MSTLRKHQVGRFFSGITVWVSLGRGPSGVLFLWEASKRRFVIRFGGFGLVFSLGKWIKACQVTPSSATHKEEVSGPEVSSWARARMMHSQVYITLRYTALSGINHSQVHITLRYTPLSSTHRSLQRVHTKKALQREPLRKSPPLRCGPKRRFLKVEMLSQGRDASSG